jgi:hypothetical protein
MKTALLLTPLAILALSGLGHPQPCDASAAYCTPVTCISSAGCIPPCFCAKQQGDAYGTCMGAS